MKKKNLRARRTPTVTRTDSPTASKARKSRAATAPRISEKQADLERHLGMPFADWRQKKRMEWRDVLTAFDKFGWGVAYVPVGTDYYEIERALNRIAENMQSDWVSW